MRGVGVAEPVDQVRAPLEGLAELLARRRHPRLGPLAGSDEVEQPGLLADARVDVQGEVVADHRVDHEQDIRRAGQPPAPERFDWQPAAEVVAQTPERPQRSGGEIDPSIRLGVGLEEQVLVGVGVVDDVPGCEPGLALADDLQALDAIGVGDLAEPAADRLCYALGLGLGGEDQVVEVAARSGQIQATASQGWEVAVGGSRLVQAYQVEESVARLLGVLAELFDQVVAQGVGRESRGADRPGKLQGPAGFIDTSTTDDLVGHWLTNLVLLVAKSPKISI